MDNPGTISIKIIVDDKEHIVDTYLYEYRSLMALISDNLYIDGFGQCGGMGRCATCQVNLLNANKLPGLERNERSTLAKYGISHIESRLSCQLLVDETLHNCVVELPV